MPTINVLDHGYVKLLGSMGSDEEIIESARMSSGKGFLGWGPSHDVNCQTRMSLKVGNSLELPCNCAPKAGDEKLLSYLWSHRHTTPFEQCSMRIEVQAPLFVFREWHRHRTQSYNEFSARYAQMPDLHYAPALSRVKLTATANKQAQGVAPLASDDRLLRWLDNLATLQRLVYEHYQDGLEAGIPKEVARMLTPVNRYSKMVASANLLNWLRFLGLRCAPDAQYEIREYANAVGTLIGTLFPRTYALFLEKPL